MFYFFLYNCKLKFKVMTILLGWVAVGVLCFLKWKLLMKI
jgi:hypothetical protein